jgi:DNA polymerase-3 subunit beta
VNLCGALLEVDGDEAVMVSTDGHRLTKNVAALALPTMAKPVIIPRDGRREIMQVLKTVIGATVGIAFDGQHVYLQAPNVTLGIKLNGVTFPPYRQVIPTAHKMSVRVNRKELLDVLKRAEVVSPSNTSTIRLTIGDGEIELVSDNPDLGTARQVIDVEVIGSATSLSIGFNATYLIEAVSAIDVDVVDLQFSGELDPCKVVAVGDESTGYTAIVMPMRI